jgi:hypothetical protein
MNLFPKLSKTPSYLHHNSYAYYSQEKMISWNSSKDVQFLWFTRIDLIKHLLGNVKSRFQGSSIPRMVYTYASGYEHTISLDSNEENLSIKEKSVVRKFVTWHKTNVLNISVFFTLLEWSSVSWVKCKRSRPLKLRVRRTATWKTACGYINIDINI